MLHISLISNSLMLALWMHDITQDPPYDLGALLSGCAGGGALTDPLNHPLTPKKSLMFRRD